MGRRKLLDVLAERRMEAFTGPPKPKRKPKPSGSMSTQAKAIARVQTMIQSRDFTAAKPVDLVAISAVFHEHAYGVPASMPARDFIGATSSARKLLRDEFGGSPVAAVAYLRWLWATETRYEKWRRENNRSGGYVLTWRDVFMRRDKLNRYRIEEMRKRGED